MSRSDDSAWPADWESVTRDQAWELARELRREMPPGHALYARRFEVVARRCSNDDVLVSIEQGASVAVVHLTWTQHPEPDPKWPSCIEYGSFERWKRAMAED